MTRQIHTPRERTVTVGTDVNCDYVVDGTADESEINSALTAVDALGGGTVMLQEGTYTLADPIDFPGNNLQLIGQGRATFLDGDGLADWEHAIKITGRTHCVVKNLALQTEDGGGKNSYGIYIEDGSNYFVIEDVVIVNSDLGGIRVDGTNTDHGWINRCKIEDTDNYGIIVNMDGGNTMDYLHITNCAIIEAGNDTIYCDELAYSIISGNYITSAGEDGIQLVANCDENIIVGNIIYNNISDGIEITAATCDDNLVHRNNLSGNGGAGLNDSGTNTTVGTNVV